MLPDLKIRFYFAAGHNMFKWADLPGELLFKISQSCTQTQGMRGTCKDWRTALESNSSRLAIIGPSLPLDLAVRFTSLKALDLCRCEHISSIVLDALQGSPVISLALELQMDDLSSDIIQSLRGLSLASLDLQLGEEKRSLRIGSRSLQACLLSGCTVSAL